MTLGTKSPGPEAQSPKKDADPPKSRSNATASPARKPAKTLPAPNGSRWAVLANPRYWLAAAAAAIVLNVAAFYFLRLHASASPPKRNLEMVLGAFEYSRVNPRDKQLKHGQFLVTLHLAPTLDAARFRGVHHQEQQLQAAVEDAMRRMRASDFADPRFTRLKNRFQERLNEELGFDGIEEVAVSNMPSPAAEQSSNSQASTADAGSGNANGAAGADSGQSTAPKTGDGK